jgi:hypothetical protein
MTDFALLVDGERVAKVASEEEVRSWLSKYRDEHTEDDPGAAHVQIIERRRLAWLTGGKLLDRRQFF